VAVALGAAVPLLALGLAGLVLFRHTVAHTSSASHSSASAWIDIGLGVLLLLLAARVLRRTPTAHEKQHEGAAAAAPPGSSLGRSALLGLGMMATNFTTVVLYLDAVKEIARAQVAASGRLGALAALLVISLLPVLAPLAAYAAAPGAASRVLTPLGGWVRARSRAIGIAMLLGFGVYLVAKGVAAL